MATRVGDALRSADLVALVRRQFGQTESPTGADTVRRAGVDQAGTGVVDHRGGFARRCVGQAEEGHISSIQKPRTLGGILALVVLAAIINRPLGHVSLAKTALAGLANGAAAIGFVLFGPVRWAFVIPLAAGLFIGGFLGPWLVRRVSVRTLRMLIAASGIGVAALLAWRAYAGG